MTKARDLSNLISTGVPNSLITLDANEIPNIDAGKITSGQFADARIADLSATKLTGSIADARIPASAVSQHATSFDDNAIINDLSTLALRSATSENAIAYNTNSSFVDVFQDASGIASFTTSARNASEYVSSVSTATETGGTENSPVSFNIVDYSGYSFTWGSSVPDTIQTASNYGGSYNFSAYTAQQLTGKFWVRWLISNVDGGSENVTNPKFQFGIMNGSNTMGTGQSIYNNNRTDSFWVGYRGRLGTQINAYKGNSSQATISKTLDTGHSLQLVGDGTNLKLYHSSSSNTWYDNGADLIHTYSNFTDSGGGKRFLTAVGLNNWGASQLMATNFSWKNNISTVNGEIIANATGNFISNAITAPSSTSKMGAIITYQDQAGVNALNTDIVLQLSADNGSNFTTATLTALPDFATGIKMAKVNDLSVTAGTQLKYKISFANQSGSKEARIRGVSLQY